MCCTATSPAHCTTLRTTCSIVDKVSLSILGIPSGELPLFSVEMWVLAERTLPRLWRPNNPNITQITLVTLLGAGYGDGGVSYGDEDFGEQDYADPLDFASGHNGMSYISTQRGGKEYASINQ